MKGRAAQFEQKVLQIGAGSVKNKELSPHMRANKMAKNFHLGNPGLW
jgi:hypothetical protein